MRKDYQTEKSHANVSTIEKNRIFLRGTTISKNPIGPKEWISLLAPYRSAQLGRSIKEVLLTIVPTLLLWIIAWQSLDGPRVITLAFAICIGFFLMRVFCLQHDCGHYSLFSSRTACDGLGRCLGVLTMTPYHTWQVMHASHHDHVGKLDGPELGEVRTLTVADYQARTGFGRVCYRLYRHPAFLFGVAPFLLFFVQYRLPVGLWRSGWRVWVSTMGTNLALVGVVAAMVMAEGWAPVLWILFPSVLFGATAGVVTFYFHHQFDDTHFSTSANWDRHEAALEGSSQIVVPAWLQWFTANITIHHVHHLMSRIPFYRLPEVLDKHPQLRAHNQIHWTTALRSVKLALWDEQSQRLISFREAHS